MLTEGLVSAINFANGLNTLYCKAHHRMITRFIYCLDNL